MAPLVQPSKTTVSNTFTLQELVQEIHNVLGPYNGLDADPQKIMRLMERYSSNSDDWSRYTMFDSSKSYTRNLVDDGNGKFNLMILAWNSGKHSSIHDHAGSHCIMKVLEGDLQETLYRYPSDVIEDASSLEHDPNESACNNSNHPLVVTKDAVLSPNQVAYIHDKIGLHRITNPSSSKGAVSLHLYTPPYQMCNTFEESTGHARSKSNCPYYSINGTRCPGR